MTARSAEAGASTSAPTVATTSLGRLEGRLVDGIHVFRGVPYAQPPVGPRRWMPPEPVAPWEGTRLATSFGAVCPQPTEAPSPITARILQVRGPHSEDCLFLNVWTPGLDDARRPVMFWVHPGGWEFGAGSQPNYDGRTLASRGDVVVVTINFRLGAFGFLRLDEVTDGRIPSTGNEGSLDQIAALEWVQEHITAFGGDPGNVTIMGESSGSVHCAALMGSPLARGLLHRAILQSSAGHTAHTTESASRVAGLALDLVDVRPDDVDALRAVAPERLVAASTDLPARMIRDDPSAGIMHYHPVIDGSFLTARPIDRVRAGAANEIALLAGSNLDEHRLAMAAETTHVAAAKPVAPALDDERLLQMLNFVPPSRRAEIVATYRATLGERDAPAAPIDVLLAIETDRVLRLPKIKFLEAKQGDSAPGYAYLLTRTSPVLDGILGACHALEIGFVFGTYDDTFCGSGPNADEFAATLQDAWIAFARNGDPSCERIGTWPPYGAGRETMLLAERCSLASAPFDRERRAWDGVPDDAFGLM